MFDGLSDFLEKLPTFAARSGFILAAVGGSLHLGLFQGLIEPHALQGYVAQGAPVLWLTGSAMVCGSILIAAVGWLAGRRQVFSSWRARREHARRLEENIRFLDPMGLLMLLIILKMPRGRIPGDDHPSVARMVALNIVLREGPRNWLTGGESTFRLAPEIFAQRERLMKELERELGGHFNADLRDRDQLAMAMQREMTRVGHN